jgi:nucleoid-associated protein YgaU
MNQYKALMAGFAAVIGLGGIAAYNGVFSGPASVVEQSVKATDQAAASTASNAAATEPSKSEPANTDVAKVDPSTATEPASTEPAAQEPAKAETTTTEPTKGAEEAAPGVLVAPTFDILRVESNGSVVIAGKAAKDAQVEVLSGADVLGSTKAQANGDFAIAIENSLKAGDYQLVLRQTLPDGSAATSVETATVSVPEKPNGPVLALVEEPGKPSRIITTPNTAEVSVQAQVTNPTTPADAATATDPAKPADETVAAASNETTAPATGQAPAASMDEPVKIEAVETEGDKIFIAGVAKGVTSVRVYANEEVLGETKPGAGDRFILEVQKDLAIGDYIIKAEGLAQDGVTVVGRSTVPFTRSNEDNAVVATAPAKGEPENNAAQTAPAQDKKMAVIIRRGDTLWQISRRIYGRGVRYSTIYLANKDAITNPNMIFPGQVVAIPEKTEEGVAANADEIKKRESAQ